MIWLSITQASPAGAALAKNSRPWSKVKGFWEFCCLYGDYQATPLWERRQFILNYEKSNAMTRP